MSSSTGELVFESRRNVPAGFALWLVLALIMLMIGMISREPAWGLAVLFPVCAAVLLFRARQGAMRISLRPDGLFLEPEGTLIPVDSIESLTLAGLPQSPHDIRNDGSLMIMHQAGVTQIPAVLTPHGSRLYQVILQRLSSSGRRDRSASLAAEVQRQEEKFGTQRVWTFFPRNHLGERPEDRGLRATAMALLITVAVTFLFAYFLPRSRHWQPSTAAGFAVFGLLAGVIFLAIAHQREKYPLPKVPNWRTAGLLISPAGLWLIQNDMRGFLGWDELLDVRLNQRGRRFSHTQRVAMPGILELVVAGSKIPVWDIYDRPLPVIADVIQSLWRRPAAATTRSY